MTETGMDYVQVMPDNPRVGLVKPFSGMGRGQLLSNGSFDFVRQKRIRKAPVLVMAHSSLSFGLDGNDRYVLTLPSELRDELPVWLEKESRQVIRYLKKLNKETSETKGGEQ